MNDLYAFKDKGDIIWNIANLLGDPDKLAAKLVNYMAGFSSRAREAIKLMVNIFFTHDDLVYRETKVIKIYDSACGTGSGL